MGKQGVIYTGSACPSRERVIPSLGEDKIVVAADSGYHNALMHNIAVDVLIGDFDSIGVVDIPRSVKVIPFPPDKDRTDTELAIDYCRAEQCDSLLLIGGGGGTIDHTLALVWLFEGYRRVNRWINDNATIDYVDDYWERTDCQMHEVISVLPIGLGPWHLSSAGLRWPLDTVKWNRDNTGIRNEAVSKVVSITVKSGALLVVHDFHYLSAPASRG